MVNESLRVELKSLESEPAHPVERYVAQRALVRYKKVGDHEAHTVCASEDWVRSFIALRRVHPPNIRIMIALIKTVEDEGHVLHCCLSKGSASLWLWRPLMLCPNTRLIWKS